MLSRQVRDGRCGEHSTFLLMPMYTNQQVVCVYLLFHVACAGIGHHRFANARRPVKQQAEAIASASRCRASHLSRLCYVCPTYAHLHCQKMGLQDFGVAHDVHT